MSTERSQAENLSKGRTSTVDPDQTAPQRSSLDWVYTVSIPIATLCHIITFKIQIVSCNYGSCFRFPSFKNFCVRMRNYCNVLKLEVLSKTLKIPYFFGYKTKLFFFLPK